MLTGTALHDNGSRTPIAGQTASELEREAERLHVTAYRDHFKTLCIKVQGEWVTV